MDSSLLQLGPKGLAFAAIGVFFAYQAYQKFIVPLSHPIHNIKGPGGSSLIMGHDLKMFADNGDDWIDKQFEDYGNTWRFKTRWNLDALYVGDPVAMSAILGSHDFRWPETMRGFLLGMIKETGSRHHRLRKQMSPFFNTATMRGVVPIMQEVTDKMFAIWENKANTTTGKTFEINIADWMSRLGMEIVGRGGTGQSFNTMEGWETGMSAYGQALAGWFTAGTLLAVFVPYSNVIAAWCPEWLASFASTLRIPLVKRVVDGNRSLRANAAELIAKKISDINEGAEATAKDIIALSVRGNMTAPPEQQVSLLQLEDEVSATILAGHEATTGILTGLFYTLATRPDIQSKLRAEVTEAFALTGGAFDHDQLQALPYLDAVVKEALRLFQLGDLFRTAEKDIVVPLSKPIVGVDGKTITELDIKKGTNVTLGMTNWNFQEFFGEETRKFDPERWFKLKIQHESPEMPGMFSNMLTFSSGPHHCIGYRFAICTMKAVMATTVRQVVLSPAPSTKDIVWCHGPSRFAAVYDKEKNTYTRGCPIVVTQLDPLEIF